ncbi:MAG: phosphoribosylglycinamide formyltransferase, partial [Dehalococcoidia bacterium]
MGQAGEIHKRAIDRKLEADSQAWYRINMTPKFEKGAKYKIGWFSTGRDAAARQLLRAVWRSISKGEIKAEICFVFSNRQQGEKRESDLLFKLVHSYQIPLICLSSKRFKEGFGEGWRPEFEKEAMRQLEGFHPDLCVLAGYMLIVGEELCHRYPMINLHPAAPGGPKGTWQEVLWRLIEEGAAETGTMMHLVTPQLDEGPPATYCTFPLRGEPFDRYWDEIKGRSVEEVKAEQGERNPLFRQIRKHGLAREFPLIIATLKAFSEGRVRIE